VNDKLRQQGTSKDMIFSIPYLISYISHYITLEEGDLILTGTPEGVGPVKAGDVITAGIKGLTQFDIKFNVANKSNNSKL
jgi:acylpyruvate hydrolase